MKQIVDLPLSVWSTPNKAVNTDGIISDMVINARSPSHAWSIPTSIIEDHNSSYAKESPDKIKYT